MALSSPPAIHSLDLMRKAKLAVLRLPELQHFLDSLWDGEFVIVIKKVKGRRTIISMEQRQDDLVDELIKTA